MCYQSEQNDCFGTFQILKELNRGATAVVYEAREDVSQASHSPSYNAVALKVFNERPGGGFTIPISTIQQEIKCASYLEHNNVARLVDVVSHHSRLGIAFELVRGPDLLEFIKRYGNTIPEQLAIHYFRQMVAAVEHCHERGVIHRDLKPENCMIDLETNTLKVIDFGLAALPLNQCLTGCGTIHTLAPECIAVDGLPSIIQNPKAVDIWGLGVSLYIMLTGRYPFQNYQRPNCDESHRRNILEGRINPLSARISMPIRDLLRKLLQTDPRTRMTMTELIAHPALTAQPPTKEVLAEQVSLFSDFESLGSRSSSSTSLASSCSSTALLQTPQRPCPPLQLPGLSQALSLDRGLENIDPNQEWRMKHDRPVQDGPASGNASPPPSANQRSLEALSTMSMSWNSSTMGFPTGDYQMTPRDFVRCNSHCSAMTGSRSNASLSSQLDMIQAALREEMERAVEEANHAVHRGIDLDDDDSDLELASEFDSGDKARVEVGQTTVQLPVSNPEFCQSLIGEPVEARNESTSMDAGCSLPLSPRDSAQRPSPVRLFTISEKEILPKENGLSETSALHKANSFRPLKTILSIVPEEIDELEEIVEPSGDQASPLGIASLTFGSVATSVEF